MSHKHHQEEEQLEDFPQYYNYQSQHNNNSTSSSSTDNYHNHKKMCKPLDAEVHEVVVTSSASAAGDEPGTAMMLGYQMLAEFFSLNDDIGNSSSSHRPQQHAQSISTPPSSGTMANWLWSNNGSTAAHLPEGQTTPTRRRGYSYDEPVTPPTASSSSHQRPTRRLSDTCNKPHMNYYNSTITHPSTTKSTIKRRSSLTIASNSLFSLRNLFLLACAGGIGFLVYAGITALQGATPSDVREIDRIVNSMSVTDEEQQQRLREIKANIQAEFTPSHRILVVGMAESLQELQENDPVISALASLCWVYGGDHGEGEGTVDVRILYRGTKVEYPTSEEGDDSSSNTDNNNNNNNNHSSMDDDERALTIQSLLSDWGCNVILESEEIVWQNLEEGPKRTQAMEEFQALSRYKRLAKLRSFHRSHILEDDSTPPYDVVLNADMDVVQLPPILSMLKSMDRMVTEGGTGTGSVVCANGFETWKFPYDIKRQMYYDTLAAIDSKGVWAYHKMTTSIPGVIKFAQNTLLRDILRQKEDLWPMQSCFGGVALYDFQTWATPQCDYDQSQIKFVPPTASAPVEESNTSSSLTSNNSNSRQLREAVPPHSMTSQLQRRSQHWTLDPKYTLSNTEGGDACEHVTFQQCLHDYYGASSSSDSSEGRRSLKIGIQPDLVIMREAAILGRMEDVTRVAYFLGKPALFLTLLALSLFPLIRYLKRQHCGGDSHHHISLVQHHPALRLKKHVHEA